MEGYFDFKQFSVKNTDSAMKVGTDAVLLGAWMTLPQPSPDLQLLDIGTGTGIIALIAAQRCSTVSPFHIDAIDIDEASLREAQYNFEHCPWAPAFTTWGCSLQEFSRGAKGQVAHRYDQIFSNPPYFSDALKAPDQRKSNARHNDGLQHGDIIQAATLLLKEGGKLSLILPEEEADRFRLEILTHPEFRLFRICHVHSTPRKPAFRQLIEFKFRASGNVDFTSEELFIHEGGDYSPEYQALTRDFYLKF